MIANIWNHSQWIPITSNDEEMRKKYEARLKKAGFKILDFCEHHFTPFGYTALWLLGESHFAIHTFPEDGKYYIELSSCNKDYFDKFILSINEQADTN